MQIHERKLIQHQNRFKKKKLVKKIIVGLQYVDEVPKERGDIFKEQIMMYEIVDMVQARMIYADQKVWRV